MRIMEHEVWRERHSGLLREAENARLARRLRAEAPRANGASSEELGPPRRGMAARATAVIVALFRKGTRALSS